LAGTRNRLALTFAQKARTRQAGMAACGEGSDARCGGLRPLTLHRLDRDHARALWQAGAADRQP